MSVLLTGFFRFFLDLGLADFWYFCRAKGNQNFIWNSSLTSSLSLNPSLFAAPARPGLKGSDLSHLWFLDFFWLLLTAVSPVTSHGWIPVGGCQQNGSSSSGTALQFSPSEQTGTEDRLITKSAACAPRKGSLVSLCGHPQQLQSVLFGTLLA